ncbi:MAG: hypothetical protein QG646_2628 [Euryarchaeota archaeon]|nr:hypothetical protein [Euryarchaeota archaeon]
MIKSGEKKEEYREIKPFYISRLGALQGQIIDICLRNGYSSTCPSLIVSCEVTTGTGLKAWGAVPGKYCFVLKIKEVKGVLINA